MWVRVEATVRCGTCDEITPVNAAAEELSCDGCGAAVRIRVWDAASEELVGLVAELVDNEERPLEWPLGSGTLRATVGRGAAVCPHCDGALSQPETTCPSCRHDLSVRSLGEATLVGEDPRTLAGERADVAPETLYCPSCSAPVEVDGGERALSCSACSGQIVVPDEVWRRVHAPTKVRPFYLWSAGGGNTAALPDDFSVSDAVAVGSRLVVVARAGEGSVVALLETEPLGMVWSKRIPSDWIPHVTAGHGEVVVTQELDKRALRFDLATGDGRGRVELPEDLLDLVVDGDGTWLAHTHPYKALRRFDTTGAVQWLWTEPGFFGRLFQRSPSLDAVVPEMQPTAKMAAAMPGRMAMGGDGDLRLVAGRYVARLTRAGRLVWSVDASATLEGGVTIVRPGAGPDGTTWAVLVGARKGGRGEAVAELVRIAADGSSCRAVPMGDAYPTALAVTEDGSAWVAHEGGLMRFDGDGELVWRQA